MLIVWSHVRWYSFNLSICFIDFHNSLFWPLVTRILCLCSEFRSKLHVFCSVFHVMYLVWYALLKFNKYTALLFSFRVTSNNHVLYQKGEVEIWDSFVKHVKTKLFECSSYRLYFSLGPHVLIRPTWIFGNWNKLLEDYVAWADEHDTIFCITSVFSTVFVCPI